MLALSPRQPYRRNRHAGLLARPYRLGLEMCTVASSMTMTDVDERSGNTHVNAFARSDISRRAK
jgi:hypothetical protein